MNVVVVGSVNVDAIMRAPHLPAPGETVIGAELTRRPGGKGGNAAVAAAR
jgi:ribokinase